MAGPFFKPPRLVSRFLRITDAITGSRVLVVAKWEKKLPHPAPACAIANTNFIRNRSAR